MICEQHIRERVAGPGCEICQLEAKVEWQKRLNDTQGESVEVLRQKVTKLRTALEWATQCDKCHACKEIAEQALLETKW